ncbi:hypothetical protein ACFW3D_02350 [Streptomyces sp. NPDC058864]
MDEARLTGQVLVFDADDTLWENNVVFERVIEDFLDWVDHPVLDRTQIRALLNEIEAANAVVHGYGSKVFLRSLGELLERSGSGPSRRPSCGGWTSWRWPSWSTGWS